MSLLFDVVYAANATGTHHKLALDAVQRLLEALDAQVAAARPPAVRARRKQA